MGLIVKCPDAIRPGCKRSVFLAGGISNCPDWQEGVAIRIASEVKDCVVYNPRRDDFDMSAYEEVSRQQIIWEYEALRHSSVNLFWFPAETLCSITLLEYGSAMERHPYGSLLCGAHPSYQRRFDLIEQTSLRQHADILEDLDHLTQKTVDLLNSYSG